MATFILGPDSRFHVGATVYCWRGGGLVPVNPTPTTSATVASDSTTTFTGLADGTAYMAGLTISGPFVSFQIPPRETPSGTGNTATLTWDDSEDTYVPVSLQADTTAVRDFLGPTDPNTVDGVVLSPYCTWRPTT